MAAHRALRIAEAIRETVSKAILFDLSDPRIQNGTVTVLRVEVSDDLRSATAFVSFLGTDQDKKLALRGLQSATGFLQNKVAKDLRIRFVPSLQFKVDESAKKSIEISKLIDEAIASDQTNRPSSLAQADADIDSSLEDENESENVNRADLGLREDSNHEEPAAGLPFQAQTVSSSD